MYFSKQKLEDISVKYNEINFSNYVDGLGLSDDEIQKFINTVVNNLKTCNCHSTMSSGNTLVVGVKYNDEIQIFVTKNYSKHLVFLTEETKTENDIISDLNEKLLDTKTELLDTQTELENTKTDLNDALLEIENLKNSTYQKIDFPDYQNYEDDDWFETEAIYDAIHDVYFIPTNRN